MSEFLVSFKKEIQFSLKLYVYVFASLENLGL